MILHGDCFEKLTLLEDNSIDLVIADLPYGVTKNSWDSQIDLNVMWRNIHRVCKESAAIILFGQGSFSAKLILSDKSYRYSLVWDKKFTTGFLNANRMPLRSHEDIHVFYRKLPTYNPIKTKGQKSHSKGKIVGSVDIRQNNYGSFIAMNTETDEKFPTSILSFPRLHNSKMVHPTEKPIDLLEYLILTFSNEGDTVLDFVSGSGTTGVAAVNTKREFVCIEKEKSFFEIGKERIQRAIDLKRHNNHNHVDRSGELF